MSDLHRHRWPSLLATLLLVVAAGGPTAMGVSQAQAAGPSPLDPYKVSVTLTAPGQVDVRGVAGSLAAGTSVVVNNLTAGIQTLVPRAGDGSFAAQVFGRRNQLLRLTVQDGAGGQSTPIDLYVGALTIKNPYTAGGYWYLGQGHTHTTESDGVDAPAALEAAYKDRGYDFVMSTDHRGSTPDFPAADDGMTPDPDNSATGRDLLWISGTELGNGYVHLGVWGGTSRVPLTDLSFTQTMIDSARARGGIVAINHPENSSPGYAWDWHSEITPLRRYSLIEAFNSSHELDQPDRKNIIDAVDLADEFQQVWWIGTDDCHDLSKPGKFDGYGTVVQTDSAVMTPADLIASADAGRIYIRETAAGPEIQGVSVAGNTVTVALKDIGSTYTVTWKKRGDEIVASNSGVTTSASYTVTGGEGYVRAEILRNSDGKRAWTQPLFIANATDLAVSASSVFLTDNSSTTVWDAGAATGSFIVDAGSVRALNAIRIDWDGSYGRRFNYRIETSATGAFTGEEKEVVRTTYSNRLANTLDFFDEETRYVRVVITGQSAGPAATARVREVQLFDSSPGRTQLYLNNVTGNDANSGLYGAPWRTANFAINRVRPRDTLTFMRTNIQYPGAIEIAADDGGKSSAATVELQGDESMLTPIDATGAEFAVRLTETRYLEMTHFDIHSAQDRNVWLRNTQDGIMLRNNRIRSSAGEGLLGSGLFTLAYNLIYGNQDQGVIIQGGTSTTYPGVYNNVIASNGSDGLLIANVGAFSADIRNNILSGNGGAALSQDTNSTVADSHNCVSGSYEGPWQKTGNVEGDPKFANAAAGDFSLQATSPCIDAGIDLGFYSDFNGYDMHDDPATPNKGSPGPHWRTWIDMGAYEYGGSCPDCPSCHN